MIYRIFLFVLFNFNFFFIFIYKIRLKHLIKVGLGETEERKGGAVLGETHVFLQTKKNRENQTDCWLHYLSHYAVFMLKSLDPYNLSCYNHQKIYSLTVSKCAHTYIIVKKHQELKGDMCPSHVIPLAFLPLVGHSIFLHPLVVWNNELAYTFCVEHVLPLIWSHKVVP